MRVRTVLRVRPHTSLKGHNLRFFVGFGATGRSFATLGFFGFSVWSLGVCKLQEAYGLAFRGVGSVCLGFRGLGFRAFVV